MSARNRWARLALGLRAGLAALLSVGAAVLAVDLADWRYVRIDLTAAHSNTLDPAVADVLDKLPEPVVVDVFLRPLAYPYDAVFQQAKARLLDWLALLQQARRAQFEVRLHDPKDFEAIQERQRALGTEGSNKLVVSCGARRDEIELFGELCTIDWGNPSDERLLRYLLEQGIAGVVERGWQRGLPFRAAELRAFHGEELLTEALLKVSSGRAPKICFVKGHGEPALDGGEPTDLSRFKGTLERDGFEVVEWDPLQAPGVPDCDVLALIGARQPYQERTRAAIKSYAEAGGRVLAAPDLSELNEERAGGIVDLLKESPFGIVTRPGIVCQAFVDYTGQRVDGSEDCAWLLIDERGLQPTHPLTEPLRKRGRRVKFTFSASFESAGLQGDSSVVLPLISSPSDSWRDLVPYDFRHNPAKGEKRDRHTLVTAKQLRAPKAEDGSVKQFRMVAVASAFFFDNESIDVNRDFALNACNWLAEREYLLRVSPRKKSESFLDFQRSRARPILSYSLWLGLPGLCAAVGLAIFLRRRS